MLHLDESQKLQVLLVELQERYNASHKIRERSSRFTLWISGMAIGLGWLLIDQQGLVFYQRVALGLFISALFGGTLYFLMGLRRGFQKNREAMIRSERSLGMHDPGVFLKDCSLLPKEYRHAKRKWSDHFHTLYAWIFLVAVSLFILTWICPDHTKSIAPGLKTEVIGGKENGGSKD